MVNKLFDVADKVTVVTGGGTGLGFQISKFFSDSGARVVITGRREEVLKESVRQLGGNSAYIVNDVTDLKALPGLVNQIETQHGPIDTLINNSGIHLKKHIFDTPDEEIQKILQTNLTGIYSLTREVAAKMKDRKKGGIIMIASMAAIYGIPSVSAYSASKSALIGLTKSLAVDLSPYGIRVNAISPGFIDTPMLRKAFDADHERERRVLERTPMKRLGMAEDIGAAALFLASEASRFITGVNLPVDGGNSIGF